MLCRCNRSLHRCARRRREPYRDQYSAPPSFLLSAGVFLHSIFSYRPPVSEVRIFFFRQKLDAHGVASQPRYPSVMFLPSSLQRLTVVTRLTATVRRLRRQRKRVLAALLVLPNILLAPVVSIMWTTIALRVASILASFSPNRDSCGIHFFLGNAPGNVSEQTLRALSAITSSYLHAFHCCARLRAAS